MTKGWMDELIRMSFMHQLAFLNYS